MISTVLVPLDGSSVAEQAIPYAQALLPDGGEGVLLRVVPELDPLLTELVWTLEATSRVGRDGGRAGGVGSGQGTCRRHPYPMDDGGRPAATPPRRSSRRSRGTEATWWR